MAQSLTVLLLLAVTISAAPCQSPLTATLQLPPEFSGFASLLQQSGLIPQQQSLVTQGGSLTIFAPTDDSLLFHTSPTLLASLKQPENRDSLLKLLLSHCISQTISPNNWTGTYKTLSGSYLKLTADEKTLFVEGVAVTQYNAVTFGNVAVHAIRTLLFPGEGERVRGILEGTSMGNANAPYPAMAPAPSPDMGMAPAPGPEIDANYLPTQAITNAGAATMAVSLFGGLVVFISGLLFVM